MNNIKEYRLKFIALYSSLDLFLDANPKILTTIDNSDNLYSYSNNLKLFDVLLMLENKYSNFSLIDLKIRCLHYAVEQYEILTKFIEDNNKIKCKAEIDIDNILRLLCDMIQFLISPEDLHCMPQYLLRLIGEKKLYKVEE